MRASIISYSSPYRTFYMCICARICVIALLIASFNPFLEASDSIQSASEAQSGQQRRDDAMDREIERKMENERSRQRYVSLKQDSERLLELATELKQYVDKSGEHTLSMDVIKKTDEIEKLTKRIRSKMRGD